MLDQIRAIMKIIIVVSTVGLTKKLLKCYVDVQKHEAVQMEIELHICSFQNPFSLFFLFLTECLRIPFLFTLTASFIREKPIEEAYAYIFFQTVFT